MNVSLATTILLQQRVHQRLESDRQRSSERFRSTRKIVAGVFQTVKTAQIVLCPKAHRRHPPKKVKLGMSVPK